MQTYYSEEIERDTKYRSEYVQGIERFLNEAKQEAEKERAEFISPQKYKRDPAFYRRELVRTLGYPLTQDIELPLVQKTFVAKDGNVNIYRMQFCFKGYLQFYGMYFEQCENSKTAPFVFGFHGGAGTPEVISSIHLDSANYNHLVRRLTDRGANVFAPQLLLWKVETYGNKYERQHIDGKLRQLGGSITAMELYFLEGVLEYFLQKEGVNAQKIGVAGLSYGGMYAIHFAAIEPRVKACYSCSWVNDPFVHSWADWSYYCAQKRFATAETIALISPRALVVALGDKDDLFDFRLGVKECERARLYYQEWEKEDSFKYVVFDGGHETDKSDEEIEFLFQKLEEA